MWNPPPIPALCGLTAPMQKTVAIAASTAFPPSTKTSLQINQIMEAIVRFKFEIQNLPPNL
jgi:hypothetical protein